MPYFQQKNKTLVKYTITVNQFQFQIEIIT